MALGCFASRRVTAASPTDSLRKNGRALPRHSRALPLLQSFAQLLAPIVFVAARVLETVLSERSHRLSKGLVVVIEPRGTHARIAIERVVLRDPAKRSLHARIVLVQ